MSADIFSSNQWSYQPQQQTRDRSAHASGVLKDNTKFKIVQPTFSGSGLTFIALPALDLEATPQGCPQGSAKLLIDHRSVDSQGRAVVQAPFDRFSTAANNHTRWYYQLWTLPRFGVRGRQRSLLTDKNPRDDMGHPYEMIRSACFLAKDQHKKGNTIPVGAYGTSQSEGWDKLITDNESATAGVGGKSSVEYKALPKADLCAYLFGLVCSIGDSNNKGDTVYEPPLGVDPQDPVPVIMLSSATFGRLMTLMSAFRPDAFRPAFDDLAALMIPRLTSSRYVHVFDSKAGCAAKNAADAERLGVVQNSQAGGWGSSRRAAAQVNPAAAGAATFGGGYDVYVSETRDGTTNGQRIPTENVDALAASKLCHPADVFKISTYDEIARALCESGIPPGLLYYAFQNKADWLPPSIREGFTARVSAAVNPTPATQRSVASQVGWPNTVNAVHVAYGPAPEQAGQSVLTQTTPAQTAMPTTTQPIVSQWPTATGSASAWPTPSTAQVAKPSVAPQVDDFSDLPTETEGSVSASMQNQVEAALAAAAKNNPALQRSMSTGGVGRV